MKFGEVIDRVPSGKINFRLKDSNKYKYLLSALFSRVKHFKKI
jgi:hypothetical protein